MHPPVFLSEQATRLAQPPQIVFHNPSVHASSSRVHFDAERPNGICIRPLNARFSDVHLRAPRRELRVRYRPVRHHLADVILRRLVRPPSRPADALAPWARLDPPGALKQAVPARRLPPHPRVLHRLLGSVPPPAVDREQPTQQVLGTARQVLRPAGEAQRELRPEVGRVGDGLAVVVEGEAAAEEDEDNDAEGPRVDGLRVVSALYHFGREVAPSSEEGASDRTVR
mmetsp:Transcript_55930/g.118940  ORF Transcript_55930/g.118940 Transcript_55930/m.118940 type:complete len:227 (-) Transcript_55930:1091-1771(-)